MRYLLDTNVISALIKHPNGGAAKRVAAVTAGELGTSIIVSAELKFGYIKQSSKRLEALIEGLLAGFEIAPWEAPADLAYARLRTLLERKGRPIGQNDMLIAAHALALNVVLVTDNDREFSRVPGLKVENWVRPG
jgi:tRNA(fMet)-specific endonuclease VapC